MEKRKILLKNIKKANHMQTTLAGPDARVGSINEGQKTTTIGIKVSHLRGVSIGLPYSKGGCFYGKTSEKF
jgi:hypothetical protein